MEASKVNKLIEKVSLFHDLTRDGVTKVFSHGTTMRITKGETVFYKGTEGDCLYCVLGGKLGVFDGSGKTCLAELRTGEMFGEMALVTNDKRGATVTALEDSLLFVLRQTTFEKLMTKRVAIRMLFNIVRTLSKRLNAANVHLSS